MNGIIANLFSINETSVWLQMNANYPTLKNHLMVKTIANLMKELFIKCHSINDKSVKPLIRIISKDFITDEVIHYLSNNNNNINIFPKRCQIQSTYGPKNV